MKKTERVALIKFLEGANNILNSANETEFAELKRKDKQAIFDLFVSDENFTYDVDGDGDGCTLFTHNDEYDITFISSSEYMYENDIRNSLTDIEICINDEYFENLAEALAEAKNIPSGEKITKLNELLKRCDVTAYGFAAFTALSALSNHNSDIKINLSTASPAVNMSNGITTYVSPILPRGARYNTPLDILEADLEINLVQLQDYKSIEDCDKILIVSGHTGTIEILKNMYPEAEVFIRNVSSSDIANAFVVGTIPPHLAACCTAYQPVAISNFDYATDGDLKGDELKERLIISSPISVKISDLYI